MPSREFVLQLETRRENYRQEVADKWIEAGWACEATQPEKRAAKAAPPKRTR
jgi:hypothetical protein